ncbi:carbohydrate sulfotransferase 3-like [Haemaphysalis longicornis]
MENSISNISLALRDARSAEVDAVNSELEGTLPAAFQATLDKYAVVPTANVKIVIVLAYYRSGSTFVGELLSSESRTYFHFEPLHLFTTAGRLRPGRESDAFQLLDEIVRCRMVKVPLYTIWCENHPWFLHLNRFLADACGGGESCFSPRPIGSLCSRAKTQVFKFTRLKASQVAAWIERNKDIAQSIRIVHLVRDPRAIFASRKRLNWCIQDKQCGKAEALCAQMRSDIDGVRELAARMKTRHVYTLFFERLAANPVNETQRLFASLDLDFAPSVLDYLSKHTSGTFRDHMNMFSTRRNSKLVIDRWKRRLSRRSILDIEKTCGDVLEKLGYEILMQHPYSTNVTTPYSINVTTLNSGSKEK